MGTQPHFRKAVRVNADISSMTAQVLGVIVLLILVGMSTKSFSQTMNNLVPNPSFEDYVDCPSTPDQVDDLEYWSAIWETPDAFNSCAPVYNGLGYSVPLNYRGYQYPSEGEGYIGMACFQDNALNIREIVGVSLLDSLVVGETYYASFKVNLSNSQNSVGGGLPMFIDRIGIHLSTYWPNYFLNPLPNHSQLYSTALISDTADWVTVSGSFIADSAYKHLAVGVFFEDDSLVTVNNGGSGISHAYLYIDEVYVGNNELSISSVALSPHVIVSPNPVTEKFQVIFNEEDDWEIEVIDNHGEVLLSCREFGSKIRINISEMEPSIYTVRIKNSKGEYFLERVVKL